MSVIDPNLFQEINPLKPGSVSSDPKTKTDAAGFKEMLTGFMKEVNDLQLQSNEKLEKLATGEIKDVHEVMIAATEAETSFRIMMDIRNKLMTAYKEMMKMGG